MRKKRFGYQDEYMVALLSYGPAGDKKEDHVAEARRMGIKILLPDINRSHSNDWAVYGEGTLRIPLIEIKGIGPAVSKAIIKEKEENGEFSGEDDFINRVPKRPVNSRAVSILKEVGAFGGLDADDMSEESV